MYGSKKLPAMLHSAGPEKYAKREPCHAAREKRTNLPPEYRSSEKEWEDSDIQLEEGWVALLATVSNLT